ncbi:MAG: glutamyl-tRNA reductase [Anaerophaga sp.]|uniref:glutamyl-tRNA reductase n=1 Tax=Anaerophaga thermohalophila TaxID=177400 RepID=UPI000237D38B|nr:glutamyl-tRNA reductase [Anaerophaga thermohalophila]MBZ4677093.1 glutamyl-tRNA reductase [Anaerophaga sp.]MDI3521228.1 glutamyl-tRNA reductase [Anaerophaga sp.]
MIGIIGLSHKSAPLEVREQYAFDKEDVGRLSECILAGSQVEEILILSTCNRTELYFSSHHQNQDRVIEHIENCLQEYAVSGTTNKTYFYYLFDRDAVIHLFRLISGLESMVVGEYQIVSQIKDTVNAAREQGSIGKILNRLFIKALEVGKKVRSQTGISRGAFSVSYAAVEKCREHFSDLEKRKILLVGAGETGELVVKNLHKRGCRFISIANRTIEKAQQVAARFHADIVPFNDLGEAIAAAEIVITSVSGEHLINNSLIEEHQPDHKVMMIDLGVPRNIDPEVSGIKNVRLLNIDDLQKVVLQNEEKKKSYFEKAEKIINEKVSEFEEWLDSRELSPTINHIVSSVRQIHDDGLKAFGSSHSATELEIMEKYGSYLSEKMINTLVKNLKSTMKDGQKDDMVQLVHHLFDR